MDVEDRSSRTPSVTLWCSSVVVFESWNVVVVRLVCLLALFLDVGVFPSRRLARTWSCRCLSVAKWTFALSVLTKGGATFSVAPSYPPAVRSFSCAPPYSSLPL